MEYFLILLLAPFATSLFVAILPSIKATHLKGISFLLSLIPAVILFFNHQNWINSLIFYKWFSPIDADLFFKMDSLSLVFCYLTALIVPISILASNSRKTFRPQFYFSLILLLQGLLIGFFTARNLFLFVVLWEAMLLPLYFIISAWGGAEKRFAAIEFLIYMFSGSVLLLFALLMIYFAKGTFNMDELSMSISNISHIKWIAAIFFLAFAVKTPLIPFQGWLPRSYYQAPTAGSILLAGLLSKAGIYGFLRIGTEFFAKEMSEWSPLFLTLSIVGVFYGALAAFRESDFKKVIAYSSLSHVNFIVAGIFALNTYAREGVILQSINHGITISALFLAVGWLQARVGSTLFSSTKGLAKFLPNLCWLTFIFILSSIALPLTNSFVGEFLIFIGFFKAYGFLTAILGLSIILSAIYALRFMKKVFFDKPDFFEAKFIDIGLKHFLIALPLLFLIFWIGIYPNPILEMIKPATKLIKGI